MIPETSDTQALRSAFQSLGGRAEPCPPAEEIWQAAQGAASPEQVAQVVEHTTTCGECAEAWRLALALETPAGKVLLMRGRPAAGLSWPKRLVMVAAVAAVVAVGLTLLREPTPEYRSDPTEEIHSLLPEGSAVPRERCLLQWSEAPGASHYELEVSGEDLRPLLRLERLTEPRHRVSASALAALPDGARLYWRATAVFADGRRLVSPTFTTRLEKSSR